MKQPHELSNASRESLLDRFRVIKGEGFRLADYKTDSLASDIIDGRKEAERLLAIGIERLAAQQELFYANSTWSLLIVIQAMDAAGKDSTIKHVMSGVNPQGVAVTSFKQPNSEELAHDFLWRVHRVLPARGMIGIFNRSHYEDVLIARVHPEILEHQHLPPALSTKRKFWDHRLNDIAGFEEHLAHEGTVILKFFLNVSKEEQKKRFLERLDEPEKNWKFNAGDVVERGFWSKYMEAYEAAITATASETAPWFVVPADHKWFTRLVVVTAINEALDRLDLKPVEISKEIRKTQDEARRQLDAE